MKNITRFINCKWFFLVLLCLPVFTFAQFRYSDWSTQPVNTKIKEMKTWRYQLYRDTSTIYNMESMPYPFPDSMPWNTVVYNNKGLPILDEGLHWMGYNNKPHYVIRNYSYDEKNRLVESYEVDLDSNCTVYRLIFNDKTKTLIYEHIRDAQTQNYVKWQYNRRGWLVSKTELSGNNKIDFKSTYTYSWNGRRVKETNYGGFDMIKLNRKGKETERRSFDVIYDSVPIAIKHKSYDRRGNMIKETEKWKGNEKTLVFSYDAEGKGLALYEYDKDGQKRIKYERVYKNGLVEAIIYYNEKGIPESKMVYTYILRE